MRPVVAHSKKRPQISTPTDDQTVACVNCKLKEIESLPDGQHRPRWFPLYGPPLEVPTTTEIAEIAMRMTGPSVRRGSGTRVRHETNARGLFCTNASVSPLATKGVERRTHHALRLPPTTVDGSRGSIVLYSGAGSSGCLSILDSSDRDYCRRSYATSVP